MDKITQAINFAKQNPDSQYATELRKRIESGSLDKELSQAGLSKTYGRPQQESVVKSIVADPFRTLIEKPAQNLASAIGTGVGKVVEATGNKELGGKIIDASLQTSESVIGGEVKPDTTTRESVGSTLKIGSYLFPYGKVAGALGGGAVGNIASGASGGYLADVGINLSDKDKTVGKSLVPGVGAALGSVIPAVGAGVKSARTLATKIKPTKSIDETIGKIIQGTTDDVPLAKQALENIDTAGIKTRGELSQKLSTAKEQLMNTVDQELAKDTRIQSLDYFATRQTNKAGREVKTDNISNAFNDLKELFTQTADDLSLSNLELLQQKAINEGLTRQEVNNIARMYSQEFGSKAFNKVGDPLTSVTAQRFENTRKALKDVARGGLGFGDEAAQADRLYSAMENTQRLIDKGVEGVNKLQQRVQERGILEKLSRNAVNFLNTVSGGSLKGAASAVFPSNVGLKTLNWLDLEKQLAKDLEILNKANTVKTDSGLVKLLNTLKFPGDEAVDDIGKRIRKFKNLPSSFKQSGKLDLGAIKVFANQIDNTDKDIMLSFIEGQKKSEATDLARIMGLDSAFGTDQALKNDFNKILDAERALNKANQQIPAK